MLNPAIDSIKNFFLFKVLSNKRCISDVYKWLERLTSTCQIFDVPFFQCESFFSVVWLKIFNVRTVLRAWIEEKGFNEFYSIAVDA